MTDLPHIGFIGLGNMGAPMTGRLIEAGYAVTGYDVSNKALGRFESAGGHPATSAAGAASASDVLILMLPSSDVIDSVLTESGLFDAVPSGALVIDMSSSEPLRTQSLAERFSARGVSFIDAPVSGGVKGAIAGTLAIMVGGDPAHVDAALPILTVLGRPTRVGDVGAGHALKALNNLMSATHLWVSSEAIITGTKFGIDPTVMLQTINGSSGRSGSTENKWPNFILPGSYDSGFALRLMLKDMKIATDLAVRLGTSHALSDHAVDAWTRAAEDSPPTADHTEVAKWIREHGDVDPALPG